MKVSSATRSRGNARNLHRICRDATFYEGEVDTAVSRRMKALEPALLVVVGGILGGMVIALYLPIFEVMTTVDM